MQMNMSSLNCRLFIFISNRYVYEKALRSYLNRNVKSFPKTIVLKEQKGANEQEL